MLTHGSQEAWSVVNRGHDLRVDLGQQPDETLTKQDGVVSHHHTHAPYAATSTDLSDSQRAIAL
jgi:hypothetical protein